MPALQLLTRQEKHVFYLLVLKRKANDMKWNNARTELPKEYKGLGFSKHLLCFGGEGMFVAYYQIQLKEWILAHGNKGAEEMQVDYWAERPKPPKRKV